MGRVIPQRHSRDPILHMACRGIALGHFGWCIKLWGTLLGSVQVMGFFDVAARLCAGDGPIAALVGGSSCSIGSALQHRTFNA